MITENSDNTDEVVEETTKKTKAKKPKYDAVQELPEVFSDMQTETSGEFGGLGIEVGMEHGVVKVISPIDNSPASSVGVKAGDYIVKINDIQVQGKTLAEAVELMRGPVGTDIEITVRRRGEKKALTFIITRDIIEVASVKSEIIDDKTPKISA